MSIRGQFRRQFHTELREAPQGHGPITRTSCGLRVPRKGSKHGVRRLGAQARAGDLRDAAAQVRHVVHQHVIMIVIILVVVVVVVA